jgi:hypothetical protein
MNKSTRKANKDQLVVWVQLMVWVTSQATQLPPLPELPAGAALTFTILKKMP